MNEANYTRTKSFIHRKLGFRNKLMAIRAYSVRYPLTTRKQGASVKFQDCQNY
jgi:hypothetical protein